MGPEPLTGAMGNTSKKFLLTERYALDRLLALAICREFYFHHGFRLRCLKRLDDRRIKQSASSECPNNQKHSPAGSR
jgi:hypothetical protein